MLRIGDVMHTEVIAVQQDATVPRARMLMRFHRIRHLPVLAGRQVVGVVAQRDIGPVFFPFAPGEMFGDDVQMTQLCAADVMTAPAVTLPPTATIHRAENLLRDHRIGCIPIVENGALVGIVTESDLLAQLGHRVPPEHSQHRPRKSAVAH